MRIYEKTIEWLTTQQARYKAKLPLINEGEAKELAKQGLAMIEAEIERRQKKSEVQPIEKVEQLPQKPELEEWAQKIESEQPQNVYRQALEKVPQQVKQFIQNDVETRVIGKIENPELIAVPVVEIEFKDGYRQLNQAEIMALLKTYFKRVATSAGMEAGRYSNTYGSNMGRMVYKLFQGWNTIYHTTQEGSAWPPLEDCFPGFKRASQSQKVNAEILWRWASGKK
jgi:hypothetical protein